MSALVPYPIGSAAIFVVWLLLVGTVDPAHVLLAAILAVALPRLVRPLAGEPTHVRAPGAAIRLTLVVLWDIVKSNIAVARIVLGRMDRVRPAFVAVPLDIEHPYGVTLLATVITMTPGTVSAEVNETRREILVHALDVDDPQALVADIKARYEAPLREIFG